MLVVDLHTLEPVYFLDFIYYIFLYRKRPLDREDIRRSDLPIGQLRTRLNKVPVLRQDLPGQRNQVFLYDPVLRLDDDLPVTPLDVPKGNHPVDLAHNGRVARITRFEKLRYPRQTARDIPQLAEYAGNLHDNLSRSYLFGFLNNDMRTHR